MIVKRNAEATIRRAAGWTPIVAVTGPRQSGKTTLCRALFPEKPYVSLEALDVRDYATQDPRAFLAEYTEGAILDEIQHAPGLLSYLQVEVDRRPDAGRFVLTGSQQFALAQGLSQSLAGRFAIFQLLPLSLDEIAEFPAPQGDLPTTLWRGAYPRIHDREIPPQRWLSDYLATYIQRDVRQVLQVGDLQTFTTFLRLCAGRTGQELNLSRLGADAGVSHNTAKAWLSVLEASFLVFRTPAWHSNSRKQQIKAAKMHFVDSGLACHLLRIQSPEQLRHHPLRGALFESWVAAEVLKARLNQGLEPALYHFRQTRGAEVDLLLDRGDALVAVEANSGTTPAADWFDGAAALGDATASATCPVKFRVVYGGDQGQTRSAGRLVPWREVPLVGW